MPPSLPTPDPSDDADPSEGSVRYPALAVVAVVVAVIVIVVAVVAALIAAFVVNR